MLGCCEPFLLPSTRLIWQVGWAERRFQSLDSLHLTSAPQPALVAQSIFSNAPLDCLQTAKSRWYRMNRTIGLINVDSGLGCFERSRFISSQLCTYSPGCSRFVDRSHPRLFDFVVDLQATFRLAARSQISERTLLLQHDRSAKRPILATC